MSAADVERIVKTRYAAGAQKLSPDLCCPVDYDPRYLEIIPDEVLERDYGCGDPSRHLESGETVLDLGSGCGKICFIASQVVGPTGRVIGVDMTTEMLEVARRNEPLVADRLGYANVEFHRGRIQDLALDLDQLDELLAAHPVTNSEDLLAAEVMAEGLRRDQPMIPSGSVDVVVSSCVLNLVENAHREKLFAEIFRVLRSGGRAVIADIVSDEPVPLHLQSDPEFWSGCISGALTESGFLEAFEAVGFHGLRILERQTDPWQTVEGIEFRSLTLEAFKGKQGPCLERNQAVIYRGPFKRVLDDDGHELERGQRYAVCDKTFQLYQSEPYAGSFELVEPRRRIALADAEPFECDGASRRDPRETKGEDCDDTTEPIGACGPGDCC